jgi:phosphoglycerate dehydrogenase-like enzyme
MPSPFLVVIGDPAAPFVAPLSRLPKNIDSLITEDLEKLKAAVPDADALLYAGFSDALVRILPLAVRARWIHSLWTGVEGILTPDMLKHPAILTNGRGAFRWPLADWVAAAMLFFAFDLRRVIRQQEKRVWQPFITTSLEGRTLGIVGYGSIGGAAVVRARAFGMKIAALRRRPQLLENDPMVDHAYAPGQIKDLLAASDYLLLAAPLTADTRGLIGEGELAAMKPSAVLINVGRGPVVDEAALIRALESGRIRGAALDVFDKEPLPAEHPFWQMPNVLVSPHTADRVEGFLAPAFECFFENLDRFLKAEPLQNIVNKQAGY